MDDPSMDLREQIGKIIEAEVLTYTPSIKAALLPETLKLAAWTVGSLASNAILKLIESRAADEPDEVLPEPVDGLPDSAAVWRAMHRSRPSASDPMAQIPPSKGMQMASIVQYITGVRNEHERAMVRKEAMPKAREAALAMAISCQQPMEPPTQLIERARAFEAYLTGN